MLTRYTHSIQYVHYVMVTLVDELMNSGKTIRADWEETWYDDVIMDTLTIYVSETNSEEEELDYKTLLHTRAIRLGQIH
jgi:hypothetical protein